MSNEKKTIQSIVNLFETGNPSGVYDQVTCEKGDLGGLSYGKTQASIKSGNLYYLIKKYCEVKKLKDNDFYKAQKELRHFYLGDLYNQSVKLGWSDTFKSLLQYVGTDPDMVYVQDQFFDEAFWIPSVNTCKRLGLVYPLSIAVVYDSKVHGSFSKIRKLFPELPPSRNGFEESWTKSYIKSRRKWLSQHPNKLLRKTVYRMETFQKLVDDNNWYLKRPIEVNGFTLD